MRTLAAVGWRLVAQGITTVEEVLGVTTATESARASTPTTEEAAETAAEAARNPSAARPRS